MSIEFSLGQNITEFCRSHPEGSKKLLQLKSKSILDKHKLLVLGWGNYLTMSELHKKQVSTSLTLQLLVSVISKKNTSREKMTIQNGKNSRVENNIPV